MAIILASGTFVLEGRWLFPTGTFVFQVGPPRRFDYQSQAGTPTAGTLQGSFPGNGVLTGTGGSWSPTTLDFIPAGFLPTDNVRARIEIQNQFFPSTNARVWDGLISGEAYGPTTVDGFQTQIVVVLPDNTPLVDFTGLVTASVTDGGGGSTDLAKLAEDGSILLTGNYIIIAFWWTIPGVSACGDRQDSHLALAAESPGAAWERLDPLDEDAAPVPTIVSVTPNHGPLAGFAITIDGSGFGDDCTVTVDGVPATSVVVVSSERITAVTPAHAAGLETVVVTNEDGVSS